EFIVFARRNEGRNGVHVGGEGDMGFAEACENVPSVRLDFEFFDNAVVVRAQALEIAVKVIADLQFVGGHRGDIDQFSCQLKYVHKVSFVHQYWKGEREAGGWRSANARSDSPAR